ncbi:MAG: acetolactate synthase small subunit, partial [Nitrospirota bacterium]
GKVVDSTPTTYTIEITGDTKKVEAAIGLLQPLGIKEVVRTGRVAISREQMRPAGVQSKRILKEEK